MITAKLILTDEGEPIGSVPVTFHYPDEEYVSIPATTREDGACEEVVHEGCNIHIIFNIDNP